MSYILDALKKSERQRPPGQVPDLFSVQGPLSSGKPRRPLRTAAVVASVVVIAALGGWAWFEARDRQPTAPPAQSAAPELPASGVAPREAAAPAVPVAATPAAITQPAPPPAVKIPAAVSPAPLNAESRTPEARATGAVIIGPTTPAALRSRHIPGAAEELDEAPPPQTAVPPSPEPAATTIPAAAPPPAAISPVTAAPAAQVPDVAAAPAAVPEVRAPAPTPAAVVAEPAASPRQPADDAPPADGRVMSIEELPQSVRNDLGTFAVSGHIWSEEPALRMLTVQDRIVREGGEAAPGVRLEEITQTGAVFTVRGWRFRTGF